MEQETTKKKTGMRTVIIILSVLLAVSVAALAGTLIWRSVVHSKPTTVTIPDNIIRPGGESQPTEPDPTVHTDPTTQTDPTVQTEPTVPESTGSSGGTGSSQPSTEQTAPPATSGTQPAATESVKKAAVISLYRRHAEDNQPFQTVNMFPGDAETKYYCTRISHSGDVTVHFRAKIRPGYAKLAEVLRCRVVLLTTGETLYDGLMRDMPQALDHTVKTDQSTESELYYEITAYLDTSVGNDYQNKDLIADFLWWVEDNENLDPPQTGDNFPIYLWVCLAIGSLLILIILVRKRREEEREDA